MAGLYIHVPFCQSKCGYCDFYSIARKDHTKEQEFSRSLLSEWQIRRLEIEEEFRTVYIGGGTPSQLNGDTLKVVVSIGEALSSIEEFTIEVNPENVGDSFCNILQHSSINRVSMGIQSLNDDELKAIGRNHNSTQALDAIQRLRKCGITNLSCDLIFGLPGQTVDSLRDTVGKLLEQEPEHISCYLLSYEKGTRMTAMLNRGHIQQTEEDVIQKMYDTLCSILRETGYEHYEISNFAKPGYRSKHNSSYWNYTPYLGLGPGAHSFDGKKRSFNISNLKQYIDRNGLINEKEFLDETEKRNELVMLGLRTADGINLEIINDVERLLSDAGKYIRCGILYLDSKRKRLKMKESEWLTTDSVLTDLFI